jgi:hypothetical protein
MAATRWFFGIQKLAGYQKSVMHYTTAGVATYIVGYEISYDNVAGLQAVIHGVASDDIRRPSDIVVNGHNIVIDGVGVGTVKNDDICIRVDANTRLGISVLPGATGSTLRVSFTTVELPVNAKLDRTRDEVMREARSSNTRVFTGYEVVTSAVVHFLEYSVAGKQIIQPAAQGTPAVADELYVVSDSALDTGAGVGARTIKFKYLDDSLVEHTSAAITLTGTTPVNIVGSYADVWIILEAWVVTAGANGRNLGNILFQDNAA